jgi:hypothetical protein
VFNKNSLYGTIGTMLFLIALYLVLANGPNTVALIRAIGGTSTDLARTLQGR